MLIYRGRQRQKEVEETKRKNQLDWLKTVQSPDAKGSPLKSRSAKLQDEFRMRVYPERHVFVLVDGQDLFKTKELKFTYIEINARLCRTIPQKVWDSKGA